MQLSSSVPRFLPLIAPALFLMLCSNLQAQSYKIVIRNRTPQLLTNSVCALHTKRASIFDVGTAASSGLAALAEDGATSQFLSEVRNTKGVKSVQTAGFLSAQKKTKISIEGRRAKRLSCVFGMLVVTNDAFPAIQGIRLPRQVGKSVRFKAKVYDAGSEVNTESCDDVPGGPCNAHNTGPDENSVISEHPGLQGIGDLDVSTYGWSEPAVVGRIKRIQ